jgi:hypothetical protein
VRRLFGGRLAELKLGDQLFHILPKQAGASPFAGGPARTAARSPPAPVSNGRLRPTPGGRSPASPIRSATASASSN